MKTITHKITEQVKAVLASSKIEGNRLYLQGQLDRKLYVETNKALELIGGKWNRSAKAHVFTESGDEIKKLWGSAVQTGHVLDKKKTFQFFQTPETVAWKLIGMVMPHTGETVLEPSAGHGAILDVLQDHQAFPMANVTAIEIDPEKCDVLRSKGYSTIEADFLSPDITGQYDCVLANPPFTKLQDVKHILKMWDVLKPGGRLASVASSGIKSSSRKEATHLREIIELHGHTEDLPAGSFKESGTMVNTVVVYLEKQDE